MRDDKDLTFLSNFCLFYFLFFLKKGKNKKVSKEIIYFFCPTFYWCF
jgi:hypothetical protein